MSRQSVQSDRSQKRVELIESAAELLRDEGIGGVSLRKVAKSAGVSTQMIYTLFGGKAGLLQAVWERGIEMLAGALESVRSDEEEPLDELREIGREYRRWALQNPALYEAMFARSLKEFRPGDADVERTTASFQVLLECVEACAERGYYGDLTPRRIADALWITVHGAVELELAGYYEDEHRAEEQFELMLSSIGAGLAVIGDGSRRR